MKLSEFTANRNTARILWHLVRPVWGYAVFAFVANLVAALFEGSTVGILVIALQVLAGPTEIRLGVLNQAYATLGRDHLFLALVLLAVLAQVLRSLLQFLGQWATAHLQVQAQVEAHHRIFERLIRLSFPRSSRYRLGDLTDYLNQSVHLHEFFSQWNLLIRNLLLVFAYGLLLVWISWPMSLVALSVYGVVSRLLQRIVRRVSRQAAQQTAIQVALSQRTTEFLQATRLIHTFARQEETIRDVRRLAQAGSIANRKATVWGASVEPAMDILTVLGAALFLLGGYWVLGSPSAARLASLLGFLLALYRITPRLGGVQSSLVGLAHLWPHIARVLEILGEQEDPALRREAVAFRRLHEAIEFHQVTLRYQPDEPAAVNDLSFRLPRGSLTALVGMSGAGKSTVVDLLLGLWEPTGGQIRIDGVDLKHLHRSSWRKRLGVIAQEPFLFHASIQENIAFGKPEATLEEVVAAAQLAYADTFIHRLADGYETVVGDRGYRLSGGQRQRIALARALIRKPEVLILDEATNALDSESERFIQKALQEQRGIRTILIIAHRLSTVTHADRILVLENGRLIEEGPHLKLLALGGRYATFWHLQSQQSQEPALRGSPKEVEGPAQELVEAGSS